MLNICRNDIVFHVPRYSFPSALECIWTLSGLPISSSTFRFHNSSCFSFDISFYFIPNTNSLNTIFPIRLFRFPLRSLHLISTPLVAYALNRPPIRISSAIFRVFNFLLFSLLICSNFFRAFYVSLSSLTFSRFPQSSIHLLSRLLSARHGLRLLVPFAFLDSINTVTHSAQVFLEKSLQCEMLFAASIALETEHRFFTDHIWPHRGMI